MEAIEYLQITWFVIIGLLFTVYTILDGFDLGIGITLPFLSSNESEKASVLNAIGPVWDGNEVWLVTGGAALFAAFPQAYATVFSGFYLALMLLLFALIFRAVSIEFWFVDTKRRKIWEWALVIGSLLPSILLGVALGNIIVGIPMDFDMNFAGNFFTLLRPFPLIIGITGFAVIVLHGCSYAMVKTAGVINERAKSVAAAVWIFLLIIIIAAMLASLHYLPENISRWESWLFTLLVAASLVAYRMLLHKGRDLMLFLLSSITIFGLWGIAGSQLYPNLVHASEGFDMTVFTASSSQLTLTAMLIIACVGMPVVIGYTIFVYRVFKGKVSQE